MKLVEDAKNSWKWFSMQAMTAAIAIQGSWMVIPSSLQNKVPENVVQWVTLGLLSLGVIGRLTSQEKPNATK